jgi:hypothetical protein
MCSDAPNPFTAGDGDALTTSSLKLTLLFVAGVKKAAAFELFA